MITKQTTVREILQIIGTEVGRNIFGKNIWTDSFFSEYNPTLCNWIISDMRFPNEIAAVKRRKGITIRINRFKVGNEVYWSDPDTSTFSEGAGSGVYTISEIKEELCVLKNDVGSECEVPYHEIRLYFPKEHESETGLDNAKFDYVIENNSTLEVLCNKVEQILLKHDII